MNDDNPLIVFLRIGLMGAAVIMGISFTFWIFDQVGLYIALDPRFSIASGIFSLFYALRLFGFQSFDLHSRNVKPYTKQVLNLSMLDWTRLCIRIGIYMLLISYGIKAIWYY